MSAKPTPSPWKIVTSWADFMVEGPNGEEIIWQDGPYGTPSIGEADARLIASAPDILAALEQLEDVYLDARRNAPEDRAYAPEAFGEAWTQARAAIARATGEQA